MEVRNNKYKIIMYVCLVGFAVCVLYLILYGINTRRTRLEQERLDEQYANVEVSEEISETIEEEVVIEPTPDPNRLIIGEREYLGIEDFDLPKEKIDFEGLKAENEHIYAWINIPGTQVDNAVFQHPDKAEYYLQKDKNHKWSVYGEVFSQYYNNKDFTDNMTVLYGHNMKNGTMFGDLHKFEDELFFNEHPYIYVYTEDAILIYQIFAAYEYGNVHLLLNFHMNDPLNFEIYLDGIRSIEGLRNNFNHELEVTSEDKVITLSTCVSGNKQLRYLVQGKLIAGTKINEE